MQSHSYYLSNIVNQTSSIILYLQLIVSYNQNFLTNIAGT